MRLRLLSLIVLLQTSIASENCEKEVRNMKHKSWRKMDDWRIRRNEDEWKYLPKAGTAIFVKAILEDECTAFTYYIRHMSSPSWIITPVIQYRKKAAGHGTLLFTYYYPRSFSDDRRSICFDVPLVEHGFSFLLLLTKWKVTLVFNGRIFFLGKVDERMLPDFSKDHPDLPNSPFRNTVKVKGCDPNRQLVIVRKSIKVKNFAPAPYHWVANQRLLGPIKAYNSVQCTMKHFASVHGSFELGVYGMKEYKESNPRTFMGITLNPNFFEKSGILGSIGKFFTGEKKKVNKLYMTKFGSYDESLYVELRAPKKYRYTSEFENGDNEYSLYMEYLPPPNSKEKIQKISYILRGYENRALTAKCKKPKKSDNMPNLCDGADDGIYFTAFRFGYAQKDGGDSIFNRTWSRCTMRGPSKYRAILDRSERLKLTYSFREDMELMRQLKSGAKKLKIDGRVLIPEQEMPAEEGEDDSWR